MNGMFAAQGWQCPCCSRVYSPTMPMCLHCGPDKQTVEATTGSQHCSNELREQGKPYPRTCQLCGFGPCRKGKQ